jgi:hypothetical protein
MDFPSSETVQPFDMYLLAYFNCRGPPVFNLFSFCPDLLYHEGLRQCLVQQKIYGGSFVWIIMSILKEGSRVLP